MLKHTLVILALAAPLPALAQSAKPATPNSPVAEARALWEEVSDYLVQSAADMPEEKYAFRPSPDVRTFGQLIAHVAGAQFSFCSAVLGDPPRAENDIEKTTTTKVDLQKALAESNTYCKRAYALSDADAATVGRGFGQHTKLYGLIENATHDNEHYGNVVTYLRMNGLVPPSSKPSAK